MIKLKKKKKKFSLQNVTVSGIHSFSIKIFHVTPFLLNEHVAKCLDTV